MRHAATGLCTSMGYTSHCDQQKSVLWIVLIIDYTPEVAYGSRMKQSQAGDAISMPALLLHALATYGGAMRTALDKAGYDDIPKNGLYVIGGLALAGDHPLGRVIDQLRLSKQAAGQLVDTLVARGDLSATWMRKIAAVSRSRSSPRGRAAAKVQAAARARIDEKLTGRKWGKKMSRARVGLSPPSSRLPGS